MTTNTDLIPGIYNHCDTWCERCLFTSRCHSFRIQVETGLANPMNPGSDLVQQLTDALSLTKQYIKNLNRANASSPSTDPAESDLHLLEQNVVAPPVGAQHQPVTQLANDYLKQTGVWLRDEKNMLEQAGRQQLYEVNLGLRAEEDVMPMLHALKDAWEMIRWYRTLIPVKIQSALRALTDPTNDARLNAYHLGKAKLVLVSIDQSLAAWQTMLRHYPDKVDNMLDMLSLLSRLRREVELLFPEARAFRRPGLD